MTESEMSQSASIPGRVIIGDEELELAIHGARLTLAYIDGSCGAFGTIISSNLRQTIERLENTKRARQRNP